MLRRLYRQLLSNPRPCRYIKSFATTALEVQFLTFMFYCAVLNHIPVFKHIIIAI